MLERTGIVAVDVGPGGDALATSLRDSGFDARWDEALVELVLADDGDLDVLRDHIARLGLPLYRMSTRLTSLDDVFVGQADHG